MPFILKIVQWFWHKLGRPVFKYVYSPKINIVQSAIRDLNYYSKIHFQGKFLLDVGCAAGEKTVEYNKICSQTIGIDLNSNYIKRAYTNHPDISFLISDACRLPFRNVFDITMSNDTLEHLYDPYMAISDFINVTKNKGYICVNWGPPWRSPFGGHIGFGEFFSFPWMHLLFSQDTIKEYVISMGVYNDREFNYFIALNKIKVKEYENFLTNNDLHVLDHKVVAQQPFKFLVNTPLREYVITQIITTIQKSI